VKRGVDTNVLVYAHIASMPEHGRARRFLEGQLAREDVMLVVTPGVLHELIHVITDARRFEPPVSMVEAIELARAYLNRSNVECIPTDAPSIALTLDLLRKHGLGRKRVADTLLAATLLTHGVQELVTSNTRHFEAFEGLHAIDPLRD
jgi:toxin-antitoxin system PIN domain toxin